MSSLKACLRAAKEALAKRQFLDAVQHAQAAVELDGGSYDAFV
jgi:hypothetical protein